MKLASTAPTGHIQRSLLTIAIGIAVAVTTACGSKSPDELLNEAKADLAKGNPKAAVVNLKAAIQSGQDSGESRRLLGDALLGSGDAAGAALELNRALDAQQPAELVVPQLARAWLLTGEYKKLTSTFGALNLKEPTAQASLKSSLATAWGAQGDRARTEEAIEAALIAKPDYAPALLLRARVLAGQRKFDEALTIVQVVLSKPEASADAWHLKGEIQQASSNDLMAGESAFEKSLTLDPRFLPSHLSIISSRIRGKDLKTARTQFERLKQQHPAHPITQLVETQLAFVDGDLKKARELSQQLLRKVPDNVTVLQLAGAIEGQSGSLVLAESYFSKALSLNPGLSLARQGLAQVHLRLGQPLKALEALQPALATGENANLLSLAGEAYLRLNDTAQAEALFARASRIVPDDARLKTALALSRLGRGEAGAAFEELEKISSQSPESIAERAIFSARMKRREFDLALKAVDAMSRKGVGPAGVNELRAQVHLARRDLPAARAAFDEVLKVDPANFGAVSNLAAIDLMEKRPEAARKRMQASIEADPRNYLARMALSELRMQAGESIEDVKPLLAEAIQIAPTEAAPRMQLVDLLVRKQQYKEALVVAQEAAAALPNDVAVLDSLGRVQMQSGSVEQAITTFRQLASVSSKSALPYVRLADIYRTVGKREPAEAALRKALEIEPNLAEAQAALVDLLLAGGRTKDALDMARTLQQRRPQAIDGYSLEAIVHARTKNLEASIATYKRAMTIPGGPREAARLLHGVLLAADKAPEADRLASDWLKRNPEDAAMEFQVASAALVRNRLEEAETRLRKVVSAHPNNALGLNNLAWVLVQRNKPGAVEYAKRASDLMPTSAAISDTLALALAHEKQFAAALSAQRRAIELAPNDRGLRLNLARIALQSGEVGLAKTELQSLEKLGTTFPQHAEVKRLLSSL